MAYNLADADGFFIFLFHLYKLIAVLRAEAHRLFTENRELFLHCLFHKRKMLITRCNNEHGIQFFFVQQFQAVRIKLCLGKYFFRHFPPFFSFIRNGRYANFLRARNFLQTK